MNHSASTQLHRPRLAGQSADNALAESFNAALKREVLQDHSQFDAGTCADKCSAGWPTTTPHDGTPTAATSAPPPTRGPDTRYAARAA